MGGFRPSFFKDPKKMANAERIFGRITGRPANVNDQGLIQLSKNQRNECREEGCHNERKMGSSRCQKCSDEYKKQNINSGAEQG